MGEFLKQRFGKKVFKIGVDGGFSCPHRGSDRSRGGCSFCSPHGSRSPLIGSSDCIEVQIQTNAQYWKERYPDCGLLLYFQAYTSTLAPASVLQRMYSSAIEAAGESVLGLIIGTRPDCLPQEIIELLATYKSDRLEVWVELGLQSARDSSLQLLNRGHDAASYADAAKRLHASGIPVIPHLIFGIPREDASDRDYTLNWVQHHTPGLLGIKIHNLLLLPGTALYTEFLAGNIPVYTMDEHIKAVASALCQLPPDLPVMRLTADYPGDLSLLPGNPWKTTVFTGKLQKYMQENGMKQGLYYYQ
ncbi:TIGR01212 family radical SAM protein [Spirochaeta dissipatitropha]